MLRRRPDRNFFVAQVAINNVVLGRVDAARNRLRLGEAILAPIANIEAWIHALRISRANFFCVVTDDATPVSKKNSTADLELKLSRTRAHFDG